MFQPRKFLAIALFCLGTYTNVCAQANANEAKAAYLLAEESYGKGDYSTALEYLEQVKTSLGTTNCKILYLQIMAAREFYAKKRGANEKLMVLISEFQKSPDYASFNEEKTLEVTKLKMELKKEAKSRAEAEKGVAFYQQNTGWHIGMSIDSVIMIKKDWFDTYFKLVGGNRSFPPTTYTQMTLPDGSIESIWLKDGKLDKTSRMYFGNNNSSADFTELKQKIPAILEEATELLGFLPEPTHETKQRSNAKYVFNDAFTYYTWRNRGLKAVLTFQETTTSPKSWMSYAYLTLQRDEETK